MAGSTKVYVSNLDWKVGEEELKDHMSDAGAITSARIFKDFDGRSKGSGIVEFETDTAAEAAIRSLHDTTLGSRAIFVREDRPGGKGKGEGKGDGKGKSYGKKGRDDEGYSKGYGKSEGKGERKGWGKGKDEKGKGKSKGGGSRFGAEDRGRVVHVGNLPWTASDADLQDALRPYGEVVSCEVAFNEDGRSRGFATVLFAQEQAANEAIQGLNETDFQGRDIFLRLDNRI